MPSAQTIGIVVQGTFARTQHGANCRGKRGLRVAKAQTAPTDLLRISIVGEGRRLDVAIPRQVPLIEVMPTFARNLGLLDARITTTGYVLQRVDGTPLKPAMSAGDQDVESGDVLTLSRGGLVATPRVYDDIVEAVLDVTGAQQPWSAKDNARTALAISLSFVAVCAVLLLTGGRGELLPIIIGGSGFVLLLAVSAFVSRMGEGEAGSSLGLAAAAFGALTAYLAVPDSASFWGWPMAAAGGGAVLGGAAALALNPSRPSVQYVPLITGGAIGLAGVAAAMWPSSAFASYTVMLAVTAVLANALPWLALGSTQIRVISPHTDAEVFADPVPINTETVYKKTATGHQSLTALRCALGLAMLIATPLVATGNGWSVLLCAFAFVGLMFPARMSFARSHVLVLLILGALGIAVTSVVAALSQPNLVPVMLIVLASVAGATIVITVLSPRARLRLARLADTAEVLALAGILPLGMIASGLV